MDTQFSFEGLSNTVRGNLVVAPNRHRDRRRLAVGISEYHDASVRTFQRDGLQSEGQAIFANDGTGDSLDIHWLHLALWEQRCCQLLCWEF